MAIKQTVTESDFRDAFQAIRPDNFSYEGLGALYDYLENLSDDIGDDIELDVIALCCDYTEYSEDEARREARHGPLAAPDGAGRAVLGDQAGDLLPGVLLHPSLLKVLPPSISRYPLGAFKNQHRKDRVTSPA